MNNEPVPPDGTPEAPAWLTDAAKAVWAEIAPLCFGMGTLTPADVHVAARYCTLWCQWQDCQRILAEKGLTFEVLADDGKTVRFVQQRPEVGICNRLAVQLRALEGDLGLSALARGKIDIPPDAKRPSALASSVRKRDGDSIEEFARQRDKERFFRD